MSKRIVINYKFKLQEKKNFLNLKDDLKLNAWMKERNWSKFPVLQLNL